MMKTHILFIFKNRLKMLVLYSKLVKQPWLYTSLCKASGIACLISYNTGMLPSPAHLVKYYTHRTFSLS